MWQINSISFKKNITKQIILIIARKEMPIVKIVVFPCIDGVWKNAPFALGVSGKRNTLHW